MSTSSSVTIPERPSVANAVRIRVERSCDRFWHADDFEGSRTAVSRELSRLAEAGKLHHIRRGLYWRGVETVLGMSGPSAEQVVLELVGTEGVGPAAWSAALALGLTTQHPRNAVIAVPTRPPRGIRGRVELKDRSARRGRAVNRLNWHEVAMLEVLSDWSRFVELSRDEAVSRLSEWLASDEVRAIRLVRAAQSEPAVVRAGLRGLLSINGMKGDAERIEPAHSASVVEQSLIAA